MLTAASAVSVPSASRNQYSNKESAKVNTGIFPNTDVESVSPWSSNKPVVDIDFGKLFAPILPPARASTIDQTVHRLLHPPPHAFVHGILSMQWVMGAIGTEHFNFRNSDERYVLTKTSEVRLSGAGLGVPMVYMEWLCGDDESVTATEQGVCLTPEFFDDAA